VNLFDNFYANFFTVGALIPTAFSLYLSYLFLSIKNKSKPTYHLGIAYLYLAVFNFGYFIAGGFYHPLAAFHRWITVGSILLHQAHINMFMLNIHGELRARTARIFLIAQYAVSLAVSSVFFAKTWSAGKVFIVSAHHWDFDADAMSSVIGVLIIAYLVVFIVITARKVHAVKNGDRYFILLIGVAYLIASIVPSVANVLSRDGYIERGTFQVLWNLFSIAGLYILVVLYLNFTQDRAPLMAKIVSIILVTVLLILQGFSYYSFQDNERAYDAIQQAHSELAITTANVSGDASYSIAYSTEDRSFSWKHWKDSNIFNIDFLRFEDEYRNASVYERIRALGEEGFREKLAAILTNQHAGFNGYRNAITERMASLPDNAGLQKKAVLGYLNDLQGVIYYHSNKIKAMPDGKFRASMSGYLEKTNTAFRPFRSAIEEYLKSEKTEGFRLKSGVLSFLSPIGAPRQRHCRSHGGDQFISYLYVNNWENTVYEVGFSYVSYRAYLHPSAVKFIIALFIILGVIVFGFNLFFRGILISPLHRLVEGLGDISRGRLDVQIPAKLGDEIGFVSSSFNQMADTIRRAKASLDEYTSTLEQKVQDRTRELGKSEERYRTILENIQDGYYEVDLTGTMVFMNDALVSIMGYSKEEILGSSFRIFTDEKTADEIFRIFNRIYKTGIPSGAFDYPIIKKDGSGRITEAVASLVTDHDGSKIGFRGILRDVTDRKKAEEALRESEEKYRSILDVGIIGYFEVDLAGTFTFCNRSFLNFLGYPEDELIGMNFKRVTSEEDARQIMADFGEVYFGKVEIGISIMRAIGKGGTVLYGENYVTTRKNSAGEVVGFRSVGIDITDRKKAEEALRQSEEKYRTFVESATDGIFRNDLRGNFLYVNPSGQKILGHDEKELLAMNYRDLVVGEHLNRVLNHYRTQFVEKREETYIEFPINKNDGSIRWLGQKTKLIKVSDDVYEFHGISRDVTDRVKAEDARQELEEQKTRFFANISHEIRTPLTLMLSPIESVLQGDYGQKINRAFFDNLYRNGLRLLKLVNNLLDFSKIEAGRMKMKVREFDMVVFVRNYIGAVHSAAESKGLAIDFKSDSEQVPVYIDFEKMEKVIMNLFSNSLKFTGNGGAISVRVRDDDASCYIEFRDTGEGIPARSIESIFDRFGQADTSATRRHEGTGIGLALAKELIEMHGGTIQVESRYMEEFPVDHGSVFTITLRKGREHFENEHHVEFITGDELEESVSDHRFYGMREMHDLSPGIHAGAPSAESAGEAGSAGVKTAAAESHAISPADTGSSVLIVDDNPDMRDFLTYLLKKQYAVHWAENGKAGLDAATRLSPDLIITDVMMPVMDGHELTRRLKDDGVLRHIPVIMLTAKAEMSHKLEGLEHGADDYLTKPFNSKELLARVKTLLKTREYEKSIFRRNHEIEQEMEVARLLQHRLLPERIIELPGYDSHAEYIPMDKVGGDFYDYTCQDRFIDLFIADVSGHGLPGAFLAMMTKMSLESVIDRQSTSRTLGLVNDVICRSTVNSNYVTSFLCRIDTRSNNITFSNAGHVPPLVYRRNSGEVHELNARGMPLGWFRNLQIEEKEFQLLSGDRLVLYTDGITESMDPRRELFGDDRFREFIVANSALTPVDFCDTLLARLREFSQNDKFDDDLTLIVFDVL
jgi:PAS domain S-box-containing protein